jgi:tetratricopeptide (TPR) repeat protein
MTYLLKTEQTFNTLTKLYNLKTGRETKFDIDLVYKNLHDHYTPALKLYNIIHNRNQELYDHHYLMAVAIAYYDIRDIEESCVIANEILNSLHYKCEITYNFIVRILEGTKLAFEQLIKFM